MSDTLSAIRTPVPSPDPVRRRPDRRRLARLLLVVILLVAATLRVVGSRWGFPLLLHPDEWAVVDAVVDMAKRHSFEPPWSMRPDHVEMKVDYFLFAAFAAVVKHTSIPDAFAQDPLPFYWIGRLATAAFGVATVALAYLIGARSSRRLGLLMAGIFAVFPPFVQHAHFATPDVPLTFALVALTYALMRYVAKPSWPSVLWASFFVALGIGIKYPAAVGAVMIGLVVIAAAVRDRDWRRLVVHGVGAAGALVAFLFVISPTLFTNVADVRKELVTQSAGDRLGIADHGLLGNLWWYATSYVNDAGLVLTTLTVVGLVLVIRQRRLDRLPWFVGVLVWVSLSTLPLVWERWALPMYITPLLLAAAGLDLLFRQWPRWRGALIPWTVAGVVAAQLVSGSLVEVATRLSPDVRSEALRYTQANGITAKNTVFEGYSPLLPTFPQLIFGRVKADGSGYTFRTAGGAPAEYVILSSGMYSRVMADPARQDQQAVYRWLDENAELVAQFDPSPGPARSMLEPLAIVRNLRYVMDVAGGATTGYTIKIYRLPDSG